MPQSKDKDVKETKDRNEVADTRPVPSQAEGDEETIDQALRQHEDKGRE